MITYSQWGLSSNKKAFIYFVLFGKGKLTTCYSFGLWLMQHAGENWCWLANQLENSQYLGIGHHP